MFLTNNIETIVNFKFHFKKFKDKIIHPYIPLKEEFKYFSYSFYLKIKRNNFYIKMET